MSKRLIVLLMMCLTFPINAYAYDQTSSLSDSGGINKIWHFNAILDDDPIGFHRFELTKKNSVTHIKTTAEFDIKFLFMTVYSYRHSNHEVWESSCLTAMNSRTDDNGEDLFVAIDKQDQVLRIDTPNSSVANDSCLKIFAYWDIELIQSNTLLNSQTGELNDMTLTFVGEEEIKAMNKVVNAKRYKLLGKGVEIDLWYSLTNEWLGLQSILDNGSQLKYTLVENVEATK